VPYHASDSKQASKLFVFRLNIVVSTRVLGASKSSKITSGRGFARTLLEELTALPQNP